MIGICQTQKPIWLGLKGIEMGMYFQQLCKHLDRGHIFLHLIVEEEDQMLKNKKELTVLHLVIQ